MKWKYPLFDTSFGSAEQAAVAKVLRGGWLTLGPQTEGVEQQLRRRIDAPYASLVTNGTAALEIAAAALGVGPGDEVICPDLTFVASASAFRTAGARVVLANSIGEHDLNIDPEDVERRVTARTKAIVVVHYAGFPARIVELRRLAQAHKLHLIEDCAHALFTRHRGRFLGTFGDAGCFSFFSNKNITCGEGGAIVTRRPKIAERVRLLRSHGMTTLTLDRHRGHAFSYDVLLAGRNMRIDELRAALLRVQLDRLDGFLAARRKLFRRYVEAIAGIGLTMPFASWAKKPALNEVAVHLAVVLLPLGTDRPAVMRRLRRRRIQTSIHYPPLHTLSAYRGPSGMHALERTEGLGARVLTLPLYPTLTARDVDKIVNELAIAVAQSRR